MKLLGKDECSEFAREGQRTKGEYRGRHTQNRFGGQKGQRQRGTKKNAIGTREGGKRKKKTTGLSKRHIRTRGFEGEGNGREKETEKGRHSAYKEKTKGWREEGVPTRTG